MSLLPSNRPDPTDDETVGEKLNAIEEAQARLVRAFTEVCDAIDELEFVDEEDGMLYVVRDQVESIRTRLNERFEELDR